VLAHAFLPSRDVTTGAWQRPRGRSARLLLRQTTAAQTPAPLRQTIFGPTIAKEEDN
jgi:hypothetical protein